MSEESPKFSIARRDLLKAGLGLAGYALAVQPLSAETIATPAAGLVTREGVISRGYGGLPYYLARPEGSGPFPVVVVIHEIFGLHEHIRDVARRFAHEGFLAVAPELYFRQGDVKVLKDFSAILKIVRSVPDRQMLDDLGALLDMALALPEAGEKAGVTGFCWGGGAAWLFAVDNPHIDAGVAWYGRMTNWGSGTLHPNDPIDLVPNLRGAMLGLYAGRDRGISASQVEEMRAALKKHGKTHEFVIYPEAPHAFHADYRPSYRAAAAKDGWKRCLAWFRKHLT